MKKIKMLFVVGLLSLMTMVPMCSAETAASLLGAAQDYLDATQLNAFKAAFTANEASSSPLDPEEFFLDYCDKHPEFAKACQDAIDKAKKDKNLQTAKDTNDELSKELDDLKQQLEDNKKLTDEEKQKYEDLVKKYDDQIKQLQQQLTDAQTQAAQAAQQAQNTQAQQQDNSMMQMMMMMLPMLMQMMQGKNGGGQGGGEKGCPGGNCSG